MAPLILSDSLASTSVRSCERVDDSRGLGGRPVWLFSNILLLSWRLGVGVGAAVRVGLVSLLAVYVLY